MTATYTIARDEMFARFGVEAAPLLDAIAGSPVEVRYQGRFVNTPPDPSKFWMRLSTRNLTSRQTAFVSPDQATVDGSGRGPKVHEERGMLFVEIYAPLTDPEGFERAGKLAELVQDVYQNAETPSGVWFRSVRINDLNDDGKSYRFNVVGQYLFDKLKG